jgi:hypothetical protein
MESAQSTPSPYSHTSEGGVLLGSDNAGSRLVVFEDPQCPYCRQFEELCGGVLRQTWEAGTCAVEYRMRCFLGIESVRADNALALAAEEGRFEELLRQLFSSQPPEGSGGFTAHDLIAFGRQVGLTSPEYVSGVEQGRYEAWVLQREKTFQTEDPEGTPAAWLDGRQVDPRVLGDPEALEELLTQVGHR